MKLPQGKWRSTSAGKAASRRRPPLNTQCSRSRLRCLRVYVYVHVYVYANANAYACAYVCVYVYVLVHVHVHLYVYTPAGSPRARASAHTFPTNSRMRASSRPHELYDRACATRRLWSAGTSMRTCAVVGPGREEEEEEGLFKANAAKGSERDTGAREYVHNMNTRV